MPATTLPGGAVVTTFPALPRAFDLSKASDSDRAKFGIPRFAPGSDADKQWGDLTKRLRFIEPTFKPRTRQRKELPHFKPDHGPETTTIWSGGITFPAAGDKIWDVNGTWNIPKATPPSGAKNGITYTASTWIGIDGDDGSGDVLQAGCDADVTPSGSGADYQFNPWWEWYPAGSYWITNLPPASAGDQFMCWIQCLPLLSGAPKANSALLFLANLTGGFGLFFVATAPNHVTLQGNCAEWIVEALETGPNNAPELAKYTPVTFKNCKTVTVKDKLVDSGSGNTINMVNSSNHVISKGKLVGSDEVQVSYV
jgi:hypothetical protein